MKFTMKPMKVLSALGVLAAIAHAGDYSTWARYRPVTLSTSGMGLSAAVTNVPILVRFKASAHKDMLDSAATQVQANGSDIRVTLADGTTDVPFEIEHLSTGANGRLHIWVLASNVPANNPSAGSFRVYWGRTGQTSMSNPAATFPTSAGYQAVFHLNDTGSTGATIRNSANSAMNGTATGTSTTTGQGAGNGFVTAKAGSLVRTFGTSGGGEGDETPATNFIKFTPPVGNALRTHTGPYTIEGWIYSSITNNGNTSQGTKTIVAQGSGKFGGKAWFARTSGLDGSTAQNHYSAGGPNNIRGPIAPFGEQHHWQFVTAVYNSGNWTIYRNRENDPWNNPTVAGPTGMTPDSATYKVIPGTAPTASATMPWYIGGASADSVNGADSLVTRGWHGWMDEVRISTVARDSNYVKLTFLTSRADTLGGGIIHPVNIGPSESPAATGAYGAWTNHRSIVLNTSASGANVPGTVTNFPVLIRLGSSEASIINASKAGGADIRFSKADNTTPLPYEIEHWSPTSAAIWVKVDTVRGNNSTQTIRMHWSNPAANSESNGPAVFDTAQGFVSVWHMNGTTNDTASTGHRFVATQFGNPGTLNNSAIGAGRLLNGTQHFQVVGSATSAMNFAAESSYTFSAWIRNDSIVTTGNNTGHMIISKGDHQWAMAVFGPTAPNRYYEITTKAANGWRQTTTRPRAYAPAYGGDTANSKIGRWRYITGSWNGSNTSAANGRVYMDGVLQFDTTFNVSTNINNGRQTARDVHIGVLSNEGTGSTNATGTLQRFWVGALDEITVSRGVRDSNWIKLSYQNQKEVNSLVNIGLPVFTAPGAPGTPVAVADTAAARVTWTAPTDNGGRPVLSYKATVVGDTTMACTTTTLTCTITGLPLGASVNIVVRAINELGGGPNSLASNAVTPISPVVPTAPRSPSATVNGPTSVTIKWLAPLGTGGSPITGYTVASTPASAGCTGTASDSTCTVTGLTQGTNYTFTVAATNIAGTGPTASVTAMTTGIIPGAFVIAMNGSQNPYTYRLPEASVAVTEKLSMLITDVQGKRIWTGSINPAASKIRELTWNGTTTSGRAVAPGLYVVRLKAVINGQSVETIQTGIKQ